MIASKAGYKRQVLELGGNDPLIVLNDLSDEDLAKAADLAVAGATKNSGQRCTAVKRILENPDLADSSRIQLGQVKPLLVHLRLGKRKQHAARALGPHGAAVGEDERGGGGDLDVHGQGRA